MLINFTYDFAFVPVPFFSSLSAILGGRGNMCLAISPYLSDVNFLFIKYILAIMAILRYTLFTIL